jgi:ribonuclease HII
LRFAADANHDAGDLTAAAGFGAPKAVAVGPKDEFALRIRTSGGYRSFRIPRRENPHLGISHWFAVGCGELRRYLVCVEQTKPGDRRRSELEQDHKRGQKDKIFGHTQNIAPVRVNASLFGPWACGRSRRGEAMPNFKIERSSRGVVCGVDEVGRGPLAGPVVAAAVILDPRRLPRMLRESLDDSKALRIEQREACYRALRRCADRGDARIAVGAASVPEIDRINILRAALLAMTRAVAGLGVRPDTALVDGDMAPPLSCAVRTIVKGDALSFSIAAASVIAKVTRDKIMRSLAPRYPGYGWETNVGYATPEHGEGIRRLGVTRHHRRSFAPVRLALTGEPILPLFPEFEPGSEGAQLY